MKSLFIIGALSVVTASSFALDIVVPPAAAGVEGNSNNSFPFGGGVASQRIQHLYQSSLFSSLGGPVLITGLCLRSDVSRNGLTQTITHTNLDITLSTSTVADDALTNNFATNAGGDAVLVRTGAFTQTVTNSGPTGGPLNFQWFYNFTTPFLYNPSNGGLLMDVRRDGPTGSNIFVDAVNTTADGVSRVWANSSSATVGTSGNSTLGVVAQFKYNPVPEPATMAALGLGVAALLRRRRK